MNRYKYLLVALSIFTGCMNAQPKPAPAPAPEPKRPDISVMNSLLGEWETKGSAKEPKQKVIYRSTSGGGAVEETLFPGTSHEMVSVYFKNKDNLMMTHYCLLQNQPEMTAEYIDPKTILFRFSGGKNLDPSKDMHMHEMKLTLVSDNKIREEWQGYVNGAPDREHAKVIELTRTKKGTVKAVPTKCE